MVCEAGRGALSKGGAAQAADILKLGGTLLCGSVNCSALSYQDQVDVIPWIVAGGEACTSLFQSLG